MAPPRARTTAADGVATVMTAAVTATTAVAWSGWPTRVGPRCRRRLRRSDWNWRWVWRRRTRTSSQPTTGTCCGACEGANSSDTHRRAREGEDAQVDEVQGARRHDAGEHVAQDGPAGSVSAGGDYGGRV
ncbi:hypothetical protein PF001_g33096, partial [Phytophthora fragariae]